VETQIKLVIKRHERFAGGQSFGSSGPYDCLVGRVHFAVDPDAPEQRAVVDVDKAPRNAAGLVEFAADLCILKPADLTKVNACLLFDFVNRGNKRALQFFNDAPHINTPGAIGDEGNGFLMRRGYTVVWAAWQGDIFPGDGRIILDVPVATEKNRSIIGPVRSEFIAGEPDKYCYPLSGNISIRSYPAAVTDTKKATFTRRQYATDKRVPIPPNEWQYARLEHDQTGQSAIIPCDTHVYVPSGFTPGWIYELVYPGRDPLVLGLGLVAVRELISFLKYAEKDCEGISNPLRRRSTGIKKAYCWGRSQSGRAIRDFIYQGFNADSQGRRVFDAAFPHVAGAGLGCLNFRFAQPVRFPGLQHEEHFNYADRFPFSYALSTDHLTGRRDAILKRPDTDPLILHSQTATEYWQRRGSLVHTDSKGNDLPQPANVRIYLWASSQHWADPLLEKPIRGIAQQLNNVMPTSALFRVLLDYLDRWATQDKPPPSSRIPTRADGTLVPFEQWRTQFPKIPGLAVPREPNPLPLFDYGPDLGKGYNNVEPPGESKGQEAYSVLVPAVDQDGNEIAGIRMPLVQAPLGTYTGWNIRAKGFSPGAMAAFEGSYIPLPETKAEQEVTGDPRASLEERYPAHEDFVTAVAEAIKRLVAEGFLLEEDAKRILQTAGDGKSPYNRQAAEESPLFKIPS